MYADQTLTPKEATRLCVLGTLAQAREPVRYSALALSVRHFIGRVSGPSLDLMGTSIELLKYEGLVEAIDGKGLEDDARLTVTPAGHEALKDLLTAKVRAISSEMNTLIVTLKFRFLHLLPKTERLTQVDILAEACEAELGRLVDLRRHHAEDTGYLTERLDHDIAVLDARQTWLSAFRARIEAGE